MNLKKKLKIFFGGLFIGLTALSIPIYLDIYSRFPLTGLYGFLFHFCFMALMILCAYSGTLREMEKKENAK